MTSDISTELRRLVFERAGERCEYCLMPQTFTAHRHEPDHIVPIQHGGAAEPQNLALACLRCNRNKGPNVGSFDPETGRLTAFFNPRTQNWSEHFRLDGVIIRPLTAEGRVTVKILRLNTSERVAERERLLTVGLVANSLR